MSDDDQRYLIEQDVPFAQSAVWDIQRAYYGDYGVKAWNKSGTVPHYVSSNPAVAYAYAEIVLGFFRDRVRIAPDNTDPIYILELGAGSGRFAYHFIKQFSDLYHALKLPLPRFCYVLSDLSHHNVTHWTNHPRFQPYIEQGLLDIAQFDATATDPIQLQISGNTLTPNSLSQPLIVIGNYFFDSIEQELLRFQNGKVYDCLTTTTVGIDPRTADVHKLMKTVELKYSYKRRKPPLYDLPELNAIVDSYRRDIKNSHVYIPTAGVRCLHYLRTVSQSGLLLLTADKSQHTLDKLDGRGAPSLVTHGGSFSLTVNYHAIAHYVEDTGGAVIFPEHPFYGLNHSVMFLLDEAQSYVETQFAQSRFINNYGPDEYFSIKKHFDSTVHILTIRYLLAYLRLSHYDAKIFFKMVERLTEQLPEIADAEKEAVVEALHRVWDMYYHIGEEDDLAFEIGMILYELDYFAEALAYFQHSIATHDVDIATLFNMAVCALQVGDIQQSTDLIAQILADEPNYDPALKLRQRIRVILSEMPD